MKESYLFISVVTVRDRITSFSFGDADIAAETNLRQEDYKKIAFYRADGIVCSPVRVCVHVCVCRLWRLGSSSSDSSALAEFL